jgi:hypothetical protein
MAKQNFLTVAEARAKKDGIELYFARKIVAKEQPKLAAEFLESRNNPAAKEIDQPADE